MGMMLKRESRYEDQLRVCLDCYGFVCNKHFFKHKCSTAKPDPLKPRLLKNSENNIDKDFKDNLNRFRDGNIAELTSL